MFGFEVLSLLAQTDQAATGSWVSGLIMLAIILAVVVVPFVLGNFIATSFLRMKEYGWKIGLILFALTAAIVVIVMGWPPNLGVDLQGGTILVYEIKDSYDSEGNVQTVDKGALITQLGKRINPTGQREIIIRPYGEREIEIIIPKLPRDEVDRIKVEIGAQGALEFRIVADTTEPRHNSSINEAQKAENKLKQSIYASADFLDENNNVQTDDTKKKLVGFWAEMGRVDAEFEKKVTPYVNSKGDTISVIRPFAVPGLLSGNFLFRNADTKEPLNIGLIDPRNPEVSLDKIGINRIEIYMFADDNWNVSGGDVSSVRKALGQSIGGNEVAFSMTSFGAPKMAGLTGAYSPDAGTGKEYNMGIVLDNELLSAPTIQSTISDQGRITGSFTDAEINSLVNIIQAGRLPATLNPDPISEDVIDPLLGKANIVKGIWAISISFALVLLFMLAYYRFSGVIACLALGANIALILAFMIAIKAAFTLPGLAGMVLTVGMAVDANVLIFERIREELNRGSQLRLAIRNGFAKATTTIVDANVTTLITAIVLYAIGTDQVRGFAVTLVLGILMSMFTAIFCARVAFEIFERKKWIESLGMMQALTETSIDFIGKQKLALVGSVLVIALGLAGVFMRGATIFDIDFRGGYSVSFATTEEKPTEEIRGLLQPEFDKIKTETGESTQFTLVKVGGGEGYEGRLFKLDASIPSKEGENTAQTTKRLKDLIAKALAGLLEKRAVTVSDVAGSPGDENGASLARPPMPADMFWQNEGESFVALLDDEADDPASQADGGDEDVEPTDTAPADSPEPTDGGDPPNEPVDSTEPADSVEPADSAEPTDASEPTSDGSEPVDTAEPSDSVEPTDGSEPPKQPADSAEPADTTEPADAGDATEPTDPPRPGGGDFKPGENKPVAEENRVSSTLKFTQEISGPALRNDLEEVASRKSLSVLNILVEPGEGETIGNWTSDSGAGFASWKVSAAAEADDLKTLLDEYKTQLDDEIYWRSSSTIGGAVAGNMQQMAIAALVASIIGIVAYIWIRFQKVVYGLAAVVALIHDVLVTLGFVALSYWVAPFLGFMQIEEFKISLPMVAAFLTIIGYSLNDTIVVFDRIREVRGKNPKLDGKMINLSINQTLSRTLLTSITTLIVVVILYFFGGAAIHGFAFALVIGVLVGTYSSIFVASPALLWMVSLSESETKKPEGKKKAKGEKAVA